MEALERGDDSTLEADLDPSRHLGRRLGLVAAFEQSHLPGPLRDRIEFAPRRQHRAKHRLAEADEKDRCREQQEHAAEDRAAWSEDRATRRGHRLDAQPALGADERQRSRGREVVAAARAASTRQAKGGHCRGGERHDGQHGKADSRGDEQRVEVHGDATPQRAAIGSGSRTLGGSDERALTPSTIARPPRGAQARWPPTRRGRRSDARAPRSPREACARGLRRATRRVRPRAAAGSSPRQAA